MVIKLKSPKFFFISADMFFEVIIVIVNGTGFHSSNITDIYKNKNTGKAGSSFSNTLNTEMSASGRTDTIEISNDAKAAGNNYSALSGIKHKIEGGMLGGTDQAKLSKIKQQIEDGSYTIDSSEIADNILYDDI